MIEKSSAEGKPEFRVSRVFDAPKRLVWEAWSNAEYVARWFTPAPLTTPRCEVDLRKDGVFRVVMQMPDGVEHPMEGVFTEVVPNERLAWDAMISDGLSVHTTVTFTETDGKTRLDVHQVYSRVDDAVRGAPEGWKLTLDQLGAVVRSLH